eukprot:gene7347-7929_t
MNFSWNLLKRPIGPDEGSKPIACASTVGTDPLSDDAVRGAEVTSSVIKEAISSTYHPGTFDVWAMAMTTVVGGLMYGWNAGLTIGFGGFLVAQILMGLAFVILVYALSEIVSTTSFSGGSYGMARVMLGFYPGFLIACFELMEYMSYSAASVVFLTNYIVDNTGSDPGYEPLIGLMFYVFCFMLLLERDYLYWKFITVIAVFSVCIILLYCIGSLPFTDFVVNASMHVDKAVNSAGQPVSTDDNTLSSTQNWFRGGMVMFLQVLPATSVGFAGIESGALVTDVIDAPRKNMPAGLNAGVLTLFALFIAVNFVASSLSPGLSSIFLDDDISSLAQNQYFMNYGFEHLGISTEIAEGFILPAQLGMAFSFLLPSATLYQAMVESKLLPNFFPLKSAEREIDSEEQPVMSEAERQRLSKVSAIITMLISYILYLIAVYYPEFDIMNVPVVLACIVYLSDLFAYYKLQTEYNTIDREFKSPFGIIGALYAALMFLICLIGMLGFLDEIQLTVFLLGFTIACSLYYFLYACSRQVISPTEQRSVFTMHVIRFNRAKRKRVTKRRSLGKKGLKKLLSLLPHS